MTREEREATRKELAARMKRTVRRRMPRPKTDRRQKKSLPVSETRLASGDDGKRSDVEPSPRGAGV